MISISKSIMRPVHSAKFGWTHWVIDRKTSVLAVLLERYIRSAIHKSAAIYHHFVYLFFEPPSIVPKLAAGTWKRNERMKKWSDNGTVPVLQVAPALTLTRSRTSATQNRSLSFQESEPPTQPEPVKFCYT